MAPTRSGILIGLLLSCIAAVSRASWPTSPVANLPVCVAFGTQAAAIAVSDGDGGIIVAWNDRRVSGPWPAIYAARVTVDGLKPWTANGVQVTATANDGPRHLISDDAGGAILVWAEGSTLRLQRIGSDGTLQWADHVTVTSNYSSPCSDDHCDVALVPDQEEGAIVVWGYVDMYAQRVLADGTVAWSASGVPVSTAPGWQTHVHAVSDGSGGAIVVWTNSNASSDIYAQRIDPNGALLWEANGVGVATGAGSQQLPRLAADGLGGAFVTWMDGGGYNTQAQRIGAAGETLWSEPLVLWENLSLRRMIPDGSGGALVTLTPYGIVTHVSYIQKLAADGSLPWGASLTEVVSIESSVQLPKLCTDGAGGAVLTWYDGRNGEADIFAQRISASGVQLWGEDGMAVSTTTNDQRSPVIVPSLAGSTIMAWEGIRAMTGSNIYAQQVSADGVLGDVPTAAEVDLPETMALRICNPCRGSLSLSYLLPAAGEMRVSIVDVSGRMRAAIPRTWRRAGLHHESFDTSGWSSGVYVVNLESGGARRSMKTTVVH